MDEKEHKEYENLNIDSTETYWVPLFPNEDAKDKSKY